MSSPSELAATASIPECDCAQEDSNSTLCSSSNSSSKKGKIKEFLLATPMPDQATRTEQVDDTASPTSVLIDASNLYLVENNSVEPDELEEFKNMEADEYLDEGQETIASGSPAEGEGMNEFKSLRPELQGNRMEEELAWGDNHDRLPPHSRSEVKATLVGAQAISATSSEQEHDQKKVIRNGLLGTCQSSASSMVSATRRSPANPSDDKNKTRINKKDEKQIDQRNDDIWNQKMAAKMTTPILALARSQSFSSQDGSHECDQDQADFIKNEFAQLKGCGASGTSAVGSVKKKKALTDMVPSSQESEFLAARSSLASFEAVSHRNGAVARPARSICRTSALRGSLSSRCHDDAGIATRSLTMKDVQLEKTHQQEDFNDEEMIEKVELGFASAGMPKRWIDSNDSKLPTSAQELNSTLPLQGGISFQMGRIPGSAETRGRASLEAHERRLQVKISESLSTTAQQQQRRTQNHQTQKARNQLANQERRIQAKITAASTSVRHVENYNQSIEPIFEIPKSYEHISDSLKLMHTNDLESGDISLANEADEGDDENYCDVDRWSSGVAPLPRSLSSQVLGAGLRDSVTDMELDADDGDIATQPGAFFVQGIQYDDSESSLQDCYGNEEDQYEQGTHDLLPQTDDVRSTDAYVDDGTSAQRMSFIHARRNSDTSIGILDMNIPESAAQQDGIGEEVVVNHDEVIQAELYDEGELVEDAAVVQDDDRDEFETNPKLRRRVRILQSAVVFFSVIGVVCVILSGIAGLHNHDSEIKLPPIITGWNLVAKETFPRNPDEASLVQFGSAVAISNDGARVMATAPGTAQGKSNLNVGETLVLDLNARLETNGSVATTWDVSYTFPGLGPNEVPSASLAATASAEMFAVGYPFYQGRTGSVQIFGKKGASIDDEIPSTAVLQGYLSVEAENTTKGNVTPVSGFGLAVDLSSEGDVLVVGAPLYEPDQEARSGFVRVYRHQEPKILGTEITNSVWVPVGPDLFGEEKNEFFGWSVAISNNMRLAVGSPFYSNDRGLVRVFQFNPEAADWQQLGPDFIGVNQFSRFGESVSLSNDGSVLVISARGSGFDRGKVEVFRFDGSAENPWLKDSHEFVGTQAGDGFGASIDLTGDAKYLAIGSPFNNEYGLDSGKVQVWKHVLSEDDPSVHGGVWIQEGSDIGGKENSYFGSSVGLAVTQEGILRVIGGAPGADYDESVTKAGSFLVYQREDK